MSRKCAPGIPWVSFVVRGNEVALCYNLGHNIGPRQPGAATSTNYYNRTRRKQIINKNKPRDLFPGPG